MTGVLKWPGAIIPTAQIIFTLDQFTSNKRSVILKTPRELKDKSGIRTVDELRTSLVLVIERLEAATPWVYFNNNQMTGAPMEIPPSIEWDDERKIWVWQIDWKRLISRFYWAKEKARAKMGALESGKKRAVVRRGGWR